MLTHNDKPRPSHDRRRITKTKPNRQHMTKIKTILPLALAALTLPMHAEDKLVLKDRRDKAGYSKSPPRREPGRALRPRRLVVKNARKSPMTLLGASWPRTLSSSGVAMKWTKGDFTDRAAINRDADHLQNIVYDDGRFVAERREDRAAQTQVTIANRYRRLGG